MPQVIATPINGARVRKPDGQILKPGGEKVERSSFWLRREIDGDVRLDAEPDVVSATPSKPKK